MKDQGQHRVSKTYLKQFGFRDRNQKWVISVLELGNPITKHMSIKSFTRETNLFDLELFEGETLRTFEDNCSKIETHYPKLISSIQQEAHLNDKYVEFLIHFLPSLLCRNIPFRHWVEQLTTLKETRLKFFNEITMFMDDEVEKKLLTTLKSNLDIKYQVNFVMFYVMQFLFKVLSGCTFVLLQADEDRAWFTTDNPVVFDRQNNYEWTIPPESEFYLPLNPEFCVFAYNPKVDSHNKLRRLTHQSITKLDAKTHKMVADKIAYNQIKYLISPLDLGKIDLREKAT
ncbi:MAG: DUF4238 domain-containing protein [Cyclobacteriaceae bacterium]